MLSLPRPSQEHDFGPDEVASLDRFEAEHPNLRAALRWALTHGESDAALRAAAALFRFWERRGHLQEGSAWLEEALGAAGEGPSRYRGPALNALAFLYWRSGELERALPIAEQGLATNRETGSPLGVAFALGNLGAIACLRRQPEVAVACLRESVALGRETGYRPFVSVAQTVLARSLVQLHGPADKEAAALLEESLALAEAASSRYAQAQALLGLGDLHWWRGSSMDAIVFWRRALTVWSELADPRGVAGTIERLARGLAARGNFDSAARLFGAADAQHRLLGIDVRQNVQVGAEELLATTRAHLGEAFAAAWASGQAFSVDQAVHLLQNATG
jgi:tetratricopeptide (TPR) repeat protein